MIGILAKKAHNWTKEDSLNNFSIRPGSWGLCVICFSVCNVIFHVCQTIICQVGLFCSCLHLYREPYHPHIQWALIKLPLQTHLHCTYRDKLSLFTKLCRDSRHDAGCPFWVRTDRPGPGISLHCLQAYGDVRERNLYNSMLNGSAEIPVEWAGFADKAWYCHNKSLADCMKTTRVKTFSSDTWSSISECQENFFLKLEKEQSCFAVQWYFQYGGFKAYCTS